MTPSFSYTLLREWSGAGRGSELPALEGLQPHQKLLLLSDGSMTLDLELLYGAPVEVEIRFKGAGALPAGDAAYLDEQTGSPAMEREVWLTVDNKKLVYAHTLIPAGRVSGRIRAALEEHSAEPIGRVLNSMKVFFAKDRLAVGVVACPRASVDLGLAPDAPLLARRYILSNRDKDDWIIKASVTEIFSPEVVPAALSREGSATGRLG